MTMWWSRNKGVILEVFINANFAFLTLDIYLAHSFNSFRQWAEWIPFWFSLIAAVSLFVALIRRNRSESVWRWTGFLVGPFSIVIGMAGMLFHLDSHFFTAQTIKNLVYTAPFAAPLAYVGLGFLLLLTRMVQTEDKEWGQWIVFLAMGGFVGNFVLSLADHAQNGFFRPTEWIPVVAAAVAVGFLSTVVIYHKDKVFLRVCFAVMGIQMAVGVAGFTMHLMANLGTQGMSFFQMMVFGAPALAPLLFPNLAALACIGLFDLAPSSS